MCQESQDKNGAPPLANGSGSYHILSKNLPEFAKLGKYDRLSQFGENNNEPDEIKAIFDIGISMDGSEF